MLQLAVFTKHFNAAVIPWLDDEQECYRMMLARLRLFWWMQHRTVYVRPDIIQVTSWCVECRCERLNSFYSGLYLSWLVHCCKEVH